MTLIRNTQRPFPNVLMFWREIVLCALNNKRALHDAHIFTAYVYSFVHPFNS